MDTLPSTSEGIYEEAYGDKRPKACCPRAGYLHPTAEDSTSADPPGHHLSLSEPAGRFTSDQQMAEGTSSSSSDEICEETHVKRPRACCPRVGYLHPSQEENTSADPPGHHLSLSRPAGRFTSDQQMTLRTSSSSPQELFEETNDKRPVACCPRVGYLHPSQEESSSADPAGHHLSLSGPAGRSGSDQQLTMDTSLPTSEGTYDQTCRVHCPPVVYLRLPPEHNASTDFTGGQLSLSRPGGRSVSVRPKSSTF